MFTGEQTQKMDTKAEQLSLQKLEIILPKDLLLQEVLTSVFLRTLNLLGKHYRKNLAVCHLQTKR